MSTDQSIRLEHLTSSATPDSTDSRCLRVAIIGCGAVTERLHLPAVLSAPGLTLSSLVDTTPGRAAALATRYGVPHALTSLDDVPGTADIAILALPNALHTAAASRLAARGIHLLVEKPMARTVKECDAMLAAAEASNVVLAVAHVRRYFPSFQLVRDLIRSGVLGTLRHIDVREGAPYRWPVLSDLPFNREAAGGGVLIDVGSHVFDLLRWWVGDWQIESYADDAFGGVEADCLIQLRNHAGCKATVELSRIRNLRNTIIIEGSLATLEVGLAFESRIEFRTEGSRATLSGTARPVSAPPPLIPNAWTMVAAFVDQIVDVASSVRGSRSTIVSGEDGAVAVAMCEACYEGRTALIDAFPVDATLSDERSPS